MARSRHRPDRREATPAQATARASRRDARAQDKRRAAFEQEQRALVRRGRFIFALGFIPLAGALGCRVGIGLSCAVPEEWWLVMFAAIFGSLLGITIRRFTLRRRFQSGAASGRSA